MDTIGYFPQYNFLGIVLNCLISLGLVYVICYLHRRQRVATATAAKNATRMAEVLETMRVVSLRQLEWMNHLQIHTEIHTSLPIPPTPPAPDLLPSAPLGPEPPGCGGPDA